MRMLTTNSNQTTKTPQQAIEVWGGVECTHNRVHDRFFDLLERSGHATRTSDLDLFAELGVRALRYPVLWERLAPHSPNHIDWTWADERLHRLSELDIRPIAGLLHHGNGPAYTNLLDPAFPEGLARYAGEVAQRYPWINDYTPINEPLTTARFAGLYGHWYPHACDNSTFVRIQINQCRAIALAMREIRKVNPTARLIQTEDIGKVFSTPTVAYEAEHENHRRWLTYDLLSGRVNRQHPLWRFLLSVGISQSELETFITEPCPPDVLGIDYYVASERFLDEHIENYPPEMHGGNQFHAYVDEAAVRVCNEGIVGIGGIAREAWQRYHSPIAFTEVHLGCTREEQLRWFMEVWHEAQNLQREGIDIQAVTAWALLGIHDWNTLVTSDQGLYEPGVYDLRSPQPRPTALAHMLRELADGQSYSHPVLAVPGWWHRDMRFLYPRAQRNGIEKAETPSLVEHNTVVKPPVDARDSCPCHLQADGSLPLSLMAHQQSPATPSILIAGTGILGHVFARLCDMRGLPYHLLSRREMDITNSSAVKSVLKDLKPWAVINAAGYLHLDEAERNSTRCLRVNAKGPAVLATACAERHIQFMTFSSDLVFDGSKHKPYVESDPVSPQNVYGRSKVEAETRVLDILPSSLVIRPGVFFGPWDERNFVTRTLRTLASGQRVVAVDDAIISPTYVPDLVHACLDLLIDGEQGIWHLSNGGEISWYDLAQQVATLAGLDAERVQARTTASLNFAAPRPLYNALSSERGQLLPSLETAIGCYLHDISQAIQQERIIERHQEAA